MALIITISLHASIAVAVDKTGDWIKGENKSQQVEITSNSFDPSATASPAQVVQQAEDRYQAGQYSEAIALWQLRSCTFPYKPGHSQKQRKKVTRFFLSFLRKIKALGNVGEF